MFMRGFFCIDHHYHHIIQISLCILRLFLNTCLKTSVFSSFCQFYESHGAWFCWLLLFLLLRFCLIVIVVFPSEVRHPISIFRWWNNLGQKIDFAFPTRSFLTKVFWTKFSLFSIVAWKSLLQRTFIDE